ncbi:MAG: flagellar hook-basal body complex protein FliE [Steroidobacteraceae bacterium]
MSNMQIDGVLAQIRALQQQTKIGNTSPLRSAEMGGAMGVAGGSQVSFANVLKQGLDRVNESQLQASNLATRFERGDSGVELSQVMIESQKASVSFRATVEIRNRLVNAYQDIMNMPI